jgi:hypothetical protein
MDSIKINNLKDSTIELYNEIDECIDNLISARKNRKDESEALFKMESLMVATLQQLTCIIDYFDNTNGE